MKRARPGLLWHKRRIVPVAQNDIAREVNVMVSLKSEPACRISSMAEFVLLARALSAQAVQHYAQTAKALRDRNMPELAGIFEELSGNESGQQAKFAVSLIERDVIIHDTADACPLPEIFDVAPEEIARSNLMTPYRAFALAVRHKQRSFAFWSYVAAHADGDVQTAAERRALDELDKAARLRERRRQAFHAERSARQVEPVTLASLAAVERHLASLLAKRGGDETQEHRAISALIAASHAAAARLDEMGRIAQPKIATPALPSGRENDTVSIFEYLVEAYLRLAESARTEGVLSLAQELATGAIGRLQKLRELPPD